MEPAINIEFQDVGLLEGCWRRVNAFTPKPVGEQAAILALGLYSSLRK